jgi:DNA polymerase-3 subunit delta'
MSFANVLNQEIPKKILSGALKKDMLPSAYLFYGGVGTGKWALALEVAKAINCENLQIPPFDRLSSSLSDLGVEDRVVSEVEPPKAGNENQACDQCLSCRKIEKLIHPDVKMVFPVPSVKTQEEKERFKKEKIKEPYTIVKFDKNVNIPVDEIREMQNKLYLKPFEGKRKVVIITEVENMHPASANSLLKTLEEPPKDSHLILTTTDINRLLPTVVSRCQQIRFAKIPSFLIEKRLKERYQVPEEKASFYAKISNGSLGKALDFLQGEKENIRQDAILLIETSGEKNTGKIIDQVEELQNKWDKNSILEMFEFLISLFRDVYLTLETFKTDKEQLLNYDIASEVVKLSETFKRQNKVEEALKLVDRIRTDCKTKNANLKLALLTLCLKLRDLSQSKPIYYDVKSDLIS